MAWRKGYWDWTVRNLIVSPLQEKKRAIKRRTVAGTLRAAATISRNEVGAGTEHKALCGVDAAGDAVGLAGVTEGHCEALCMMVGCCGGVVRI